MTDLILGKGRLFFDRFTPGTLIGGGYLYFGNTPSLSTTRAQESLEHVSSEGGINLVDRTVKTRDDLSGSFSTDHISPANLALWYGGEHSIFTDSSGTGVITTIPSATKGRTYQLGKTAANPEGLTNVSNVVVKDDTDAVIAATGNYTVDLVLGLLTISDTSAAIANGDEITVTFDNAAGTREMVIEQNEVIEGTLMFLADNPVGPNNDYIWPYVQLQSDGDHALKGDEWQVMSFNFTAQKLDLNTPRQIIRKRAATG